MTRPMSARQALLALTIELAALTALARYGWRHMWKGCQSPSGSKVPHDRDEV